MQTLMIGTFIDVLYPFVEDNLKASGNVTDDTSFAESLFGSADYAGVYDSKERKSRRSNDGNVPGWESSPKGGDPPEFEPSNQAEISHGDVD